MDEGWDEQWCLHKYLGGNNDAMVQVEILTDVYVCGGRGAGGEQEGR